MKIFQIPEGYENEDNCCPFCGFVENTPPEKIIFLKPGFLLNDRYLIGTTIGEGGFGITYRAWDNTLDSMVVIKEYYPSGLATRTNQTSVETFTDEDSDSFNRGLSRFLKEARGLARFKKVRNTVNIYDFFEANGTAYLVMEALEGCNMKEYQDEVGDALSFEEVSKMADDICDALVSIHSEGIIHRDISPDNIFKCSDGTYKLIDFGAIKQNDGSGEKSQTVILKQGYAPIEQYKKNGDIGVWTDIYSFAATLYKLLTNIRPDEVIDRMEKDEVKDICLLNPEVPRGFGKAVMKAMSINKEDRYYSVEDFKAALHERFQGIEDNGIGTTKPYVTSVLTSDMEDSKKINLGNVTKVDSNKKLTFVLIAIIAVLVIGAVIYLALPTNKESDVASVENTEEVSEDNVSKQEISTETQEVNDESTEEGTEVPATSVWVLDGIKVNTSENDSTSDFKVLGYGVDKLFFHSTVIEGKDNEGLNLKIRFIFPDGSSKEGTEVVYKNHTFYRAIGSLDASGNSTPFAKGEISCEMIDDDTGAVLASTTVTIN